MSKTSIALFEITNSVRFLKRSAKNKNRGMFDSNANYLRGLVEALIMQQAKTFDAPTAPVQPLYAVRLYSKITQTEASFDVRASSELAAVRALVNRGFHNKDHIVRGVNLVRA
jgi:hypothetical protein